MQYVHISDHFGRKGSPSEDVRLGLNFFVNRIFVYLLSFSDHYGRKGSRSEDVRRLDGTCRPESGALPTAVEASPEIAGPIFFFLLHIQSWRNLLCNTNNKRPESGAFPTTGVTYHIPIILLLLLVIWIPNFWVTEWVSYWQGKAIIELRSEKNYIVL